MKDFAFSISDLTDCLHVEEIDTNLFRGNSLTLGLPRVFGGQVAAQALNAGYRTVDPERRPHSLHAYFLRPGDNQRPIIYEVDPIRDGRSFSTRRVVAKQNGKAIFNCSISFQITEDGLSHQMDLPIDVPMPEDLQPDVEWAKSLGQSGSGLTEEKYRAMMLLFNTDVVDMRSTHRITSIEPTIDEPHHGFWFKFGGDIGDDPVTHRTLLTFISDKALMSTGLRPHPVSFTSHKIIGASLDHAMWFHSDIRVDQWLYYYMDSPRSARARDYNRGSFYTREGKLIASTAQEGLIRVVGKKEKNNGTIKG